VVLSASTSGPRETVINVIHAVVAETEKFSEVAGMKRERERDGAQVTLAVTRSMFELRHWKCAVAK